MQDLPKAMQHLSMPRLQKPSLDRKLESFPKMHRYKCLHYPMLEYVPTGTQRVENRIVVTSEDANSVMLRRGAVRGTNIDQLLERLFASIVTFPLACPWLSVIL